MSLIKYFLPAYYLRRPKRLFVLSFVLIAGVFLLLRRQHKARQVQALAAKVHALHSQKQSMVAELEKTRMGAHGKSKEGEEAGEEEESFRVVPVNLRTRGRAGVGERGRGGGRRGGKRGGGRGGVEGRGRDGRRRRKGRARRKRRRRRGGVGEVD
ncbi:hypothetical protein CLOM_g20525 [Closterium sp. NIES-68]|nr:hypothetical protein CLOM_g20525 [Closterium sp. NIES-68]